MPNEEKHLTAEPVKKTSGKKKTNQKAFLKQFVK